jgi:hypothetical protein
VNRLARSNGQHDASVLDLEPGQVPAASDGLQDRLMNDNYTSRPATTRIPDPF